MQPNQDPELPLRVPSDEKGDALQRQIDGDIAAFVPPPVADEPASGPLECGVTRDELSALASRVRVLECEIGLPLLHPFAPHAHTPVPGESKHGDRVCVRCVQPIRYDTDVGAWVSA